MSAPHPIELARPSRVSRFQEERTLFVNALLENANNLRADPRFAANAAANMFDLVRQVHRIRAASLAMDTNSRSHPYVRAKPYAFYSYNVPLMCNDLIASLLHWADILVNTDGRRTDVIVVESILQMVTSIGF